MFSYFVTESIRIDPLSRRYVSTLNLSSSLLSCVPQVRVLNADVFVYDSSYVESSVPGSLSLSQSHS